MASACVNQMVDSSPSWFSPRISFSRDFALNQAPQSSNFVVEEGDFEFRLNDPVKKMLPADELFSGGKLMPMQLKDTETTTTEESLEFDLSLNDKKEEEDNGGDDKILINDIFDKNFSPKAPKCASRWREILGLKKSQKVEDHQNKSSSLKSLKSFLHRNPKSDSPSMNLPLLKDLDTETEPEQEPEPEPVSISSRLSLSSSSSSCPDHEDLPRLSLDSDKPNLPKVKLTKPKAKPKPKAVVVARNSRTGRSVARRAPDSNNSSRGASVDSPRMNSSGKIVFHSLERSSSSPSSFNGGPRMKARGMERSYSANVRIRPVLNVPVCRGSSKSGYVFGFGQFFSSSSQKRDGNGGTRNQSTKKNSSEIIRFRGQETLII